MGVTGQTARAASGADSDVPPTRCERHRDPFHRFVERSGIDIAAVPLPLTWFLRLADGNLRLSPVAIRARLRNRSAPTTGSARDRHPAKRLDRTG